MTRKALLAVLFGILLLLGCQINKGYAAQGTENKQDSRRIVVFGMDDTGSYEYWEQAKFIAARIIDQLQPGDTLYCRKITDTSYLDNCHIVKLELPLYEKAGGRNPYDRKSKKLEQAFLSQIEFIKRDAHSRLVALRPSKSRHTDIYGFIAAASDRFSLASKEHRRILILASDLEDNVGHEPKVNLSGVSVAVLGFQSSKDPAKAQKVKEKWTRRFTEAGSTGVVFMSLEEKVNLNRFKGD